MRDCVRSRVCGGPSLARSIIGPPAGEPWAMRPSLSTCLHGCCLPASSMMYPGHFAVLGRDFGALGVLVRGERYSAFDSPDTSAFRIVGTISRAMGSGSLTVCIGAVRIGNDTATSGSGGLHGSS